MSSHDTAFKATLAGVRDQFRRRERRTLRSDERLDGKTALITGATGGLGQAIAEQLAARGARLLLPCRSSGDELAARVRAKTGVEVELFDLDLAEHSSVQALLDALTESGERIDRLVLNAAVVPARSRRSSAGLDFMFHVNFLANVELVEGLLERDLIAGAEGDPARILFVSSEAHRSGEPGDIDQLGAPEDYGTAGVLQHYGRNKLYLTAYAWALGDRLAAERVGVFVLGPGAVASNIAREAPGWMRVVLDPIMRLAFQAPEVAAEPATWLCCAEQLRGQTGVYLHMHARKDPAPWARDLDNGRRLREAGLALLDAP